MLRSSQTHFGAPPLASSRCAALEKVEKKIVGACGTNVQAAQITVRTSDALAYAVSRSFRRVIARLSDASDTRAGA